MAQNESAKNLRHSIYGIRQNSRFQFIEQEVDKLQSQINSLMHEATEIVQEELGEEYYALKMLEGISIHWSGLDVTDEDDD